jgi:cardiolipin synthase
VALRPGMGVSPIIQDVRGRIAATLLCLLLLAGCAPFDITHGESTASHAPLVGCTGDACTVNTGVNGVQLFVEPGAAEKPVVQAIATATRSVWVEVYLLTDRAVIHALEDAANRRVDVRVLLELHPFGGGAVAARQTLEELKLAGVQVRAASPAFTYSHAKMMLVDRATLYVMEYTP